MQSKIMLAKKTYDMSEKEILQLEREWYAGRYIGNTEKYYDINVMAALIYLLKKNNGSFYELDKYISAGKINNPNFQNTMKAYISKTHVKNFLQKHLNLDDFLLLGIALFYNEFKMSREINSLDLNKTLNLTIEHLLKLDIENEFSFMQVGLSNGSMLVDLIMKYNLKNYLAYNREPNLMVSLQLRALLLETLDSQLIESDVLNGAFVINDQLFDHILCIPIWNGRFKQTQVMNPKVKRQLDAIGKRPINTDWLEVLGSFEYLSTEGTMVALMTNSALTSSQNQAIRSYFVDHGYIQAVIELPDSLSEFTRIPLYAVVLSHNNNEIKFIDASEFYIQERRYKNIDLDRLKTLISDNTENSCVVSKSRVYEEEYNLLPKRYTAEPITYDGTPLGEICNISRGPVIPSKELDEITTLEDTGIRYVYSQALDTQQVDMSQLPFVDKFKLEKSSQVIEEDSLVLTRTSPFKSNMLHLQPGAGVIINGNLFSITIAPKYRNLYLLDYIAAFFNSTLGREQIERLASGSVIKSISIKDLKSLAIPNAAIEQQRSFLNQTDKIIETRMELLKKLDEVNQELNKLVEEEFNW
ncbi:MAG: N-6 DNA methylase [Veillonella parvula]|uniref:N-6 DNA methylase n=1 Tax=Veillonella parvula TaxID=29466 RepID=A0A943AAU2_VEIPA|nr:type I restriction-modification system subunit M/S [Veillonella parvula]MBS4893183.1 N-6 DNA methylase [Veillonella parvula]